MVDVLLFGFWGVFVYFVFALMLKYPRVYRIDVSGMGALQVNRQTGFPGHLQFKKTNDKWDKGGSCNNNILSTTTTKPLQF